MKKNKMKKIKKKLKLIFYLIDKPDLDILITKTIQETNYTNNYEPLEQSNYD